MKVIIDLIQSIREEINDQGDFTLLAMLLKESESGEMRLIGEKPISRAQIIDNQLIFYVDMKERLVQVEPLLRVLNNLKNDEMMMSVKVSVSEQFFDIIGFGKSEKDKKFVVFIESH